MQLPKKPSAARAFHQERAVRDPKTGIVGDDEVKSLNIYLKMKYAIQ